MIAHEGDKVFAGSVPTLYDTYLVPLIFEPYADDIARRLRMLPVSRVLEVACGTGVVTRAMSSALPPSVQIVATDLNQPMLDYAASKPMSRDIEWRKADAMALPFPDETFDAVVCQFGAMFFPDKPKAFSEARRVLKRGGSYIFSVWDRIEENEFADIVTASLASLFPDDPPRFMARTPHGYHDSASVERDVQSGGFTNPQIETIAARSRAESARIAAIAYCEGTPLRDEIIARNPSRLDEATDVATDALASRFGDGNVDGKIQAHVIVATRD
jgi:SAM-dependent methyltransferase